MLKTRRPINKLPTAIRFYEDQMKFFAEYKKTMEELKTNQTDLIREGLDIMIKKVKEELKKRGEK